jgi:hypothetical protein
MNLNDTLQIVFSGVVALSTVVYSILTWRLVSKTRRMREFPSLSLACLKNKSIAVRSL